MGDAVTEGGIGDFLVPQDLAVLGVEGDQVGIQRSHVHMGAAVYGHPAIVRAATGDGAAQLVLVPPHLLLGLQIVGDERVVGRRHEHHAVGDDRRILERAQLGDPGLEDHPGHQLRHVRGGDRFEGGVSLIPVVAAVRRPVATLGRSLTRHGEEHRGHPPTRPHAHGHSSFQQDLMCGNGPWRSAMDPEERPPGSGIRYVPARRSREWRPHRPDRGAGLHTRRCPDRACRWRATAGVIGAVGGRPEGVVESGALSVEPVTICDARCASQDPRIPTV